MISRNSANLIILGSSPTLPEWSNNLYRDNLAVGYPGSDASTHWFNRNMSNNNGYILRSGNDNNELYFGYWGGGGMLSQPVPNVYWGSPNNPIENISWSMAIGYCNLRSIKEGLTPCYGYSTYTGLQFFEWPSDWAYSANINLITCDWTANGYRLPTESEWHFAARGGNLMSHNYLYSGSDTLGQVGWWSGNSGGVHREVKTLLPNDLGIYDMSGNVHEWCWDLYGAYPSGNRTDYRGASTGTDRVRRGGHWKATVASTQEITYRGYASTNSDTTGFRVVKNTAFQDPSEGVFVSSGSFNNGTSIMTVSQFYMCKHQVTNIEFQRVNSFYPLVSGKTYKYRIVLQYNHWRGGNSPSMYVVVKTPTVDTGYPSYTPWTNNENLRTEYSKNHGVIANDATKEFIGEFTLTGNITRFTNMAIFCSNDIYSNEKKWWIKAWELYEKKN